MADDFDASINGSYGEAAKGYWWELLVPYTRSRDHFDAQKVAAQRFAVQAEIPGLLRSFSPETVVDLFTGIIQRTNEGFEHDLNTAKLDNVYLMVRMQRWQGRIASSSSRIWPILMPFAFRRPLEAALSTAPLRRLRNRMSRRLIEYFDRDLATLPLAQGYPALSLRLTTAHLFWPLGVEVWHKVKQRIGAAGNRATVATSPYYPFPFSALWHLEEVRDLLDPCSMASRDLYSIERLRSLLETSHKRTFDFAPHVGRILTLEMVARLIGLPREVT